MGWFLFNATSKRGKKRKPAKAAVKQPWDRAMMFRILRGVATVAVVIGIGVGWFWGERRLRDKVAGAKRPVVRVELVGLPQWMPVKVADQLRGIAAANLVANPFDQASLARVAVELSASPWVTRVERVVRKNGGLVEVIADYRGRAALLKSGSSYHLIDIEGVRLPYVYTAWEAAQTGLPMIHGVAAAPPLDGRPWSGHDVKAGLRMAAFVADQPWNQKVLAVDVTNFQGRRDKGRAFLKLLTALDGDEDPLNNPGIEWGRPPGEELFYEPTAAWKTDRIAAEVRRDPKLDARIVNVTSEAGVTMRLPTDDDADSLVFAEDKPAPDPSPARSNPSQTRRPTRIPR